MTNITTGISIQKAWAEIRKKCFAHFGCQCLFYGNPATVVHHRTYDNIGKENVPKDLSPLCDECHNRFHDIARDYWRKFRVSVEGKGNDLQLFPEPNLPSIYGIQIIQGIQNARDIFTEGAFWLIAFRSRDTLQANLCMQSSTHYKRLKEQRDTIQGDFEGNAFGELKWQDEKRWVGFLNSTVGHVKAANREDEFSWLHDRLIRLQEVFSPRIAKIQGQGN